VREAVGDAVAARSHKGRYFFLTDGLSDLTWDEVSAPAS
jgi:hypothetical protein